VRGDANCVAQCGCEGALKVVPMELDGAMFERAQVNARLCAGCGACVAVCPHRAIDLNGWRTDQFEAMADKLAADIPSRACSADPISIKYQIMKNLQKMQISAWKAGVLSS
jgi:heterodisulfide reductase subunit A